MNVFIALRPFVVFSMHTVYYIQGLLIVFLMIISSSLSGSGDFVLFSLIGNCFIRKCFGDIPILCIMHTFVTLDFWIFFFFLQDH